MCTNIIKVRDRGGGRESKVIEREGLKRMIYRSNQFMILDEVFDLHLSSAFVYVCTYVVQVFRCCKFRLLKKKGKNSLLGSSFFLHLSEIFLVSNFPLQVEEKKREKKVDEQINRLISFARPLLTHLTHLERV